MNVALNEVLLAPEIVNSIVSALIARHVKAFDTLSVIGAVILFAFIPDTIATPLLSVVIACVVTSTNTLASATEITSVMLPVLTKSVVSAVCVNELTLCTDKYPYLSTLILKFNCLSAVVTVNCKLSEITPATSSSGPYPSVNCPP